MFLFQIVLSKRVCFGILLVTNDNCVNPLQDNTDSRTDNCAFCTQIYYCYGRIFMGNIWYVKQKYKMNYKLEIILIIKIQQTILISKRCFSIDGIFGRQSTSGKTGTCSLSNVSFLLYNFLAHYLSHKLNLQANQTRYVDNNFVFYINIIIHFAQVLTNLFT